VAYFKVYSSISMEELRKSKKTPSRDGRNPDRDSNDVMNAEQECQPLDGNVRLH